MEKFISSDGLYWPGVLKGIKKASNPLQPIFEVITNSFEAIDMRSKLNAPFEPFITIELFYNETTDKQPDGLAEVHVTDNGIGFDDSNFKRLTIFKDDTKGYSNRGSGRIQLVQSFKQVMYHSVYCQAGVKYVREFSLSKAFQFIQKNAIIRLDKEEVVIGEKDNCTQVKLIELRDKNDVKFFNNLTISDLKQKIIDHYILFLCTNRESLPKIDIKFYHLSKCIAHTDITLSDIPMPSKDDAVISISKSRISEDMKHIEASEEKVDVKIRSYKISSNILPKNSIKVTCKNEVVDSVKLKIGSLPADKIIDGSHFLFLLSSDYFDNQIGDTRDHFEILNKADFKKIAKSQGYISEQLVLDDLAEGVNSVAIRLYDEIAKQEEEQQRIIKSLRETYLLSEEALAEVCPNDSPDDIVRKAYAYDAKVNANRDMNIQKSIDQIRNLNPSDDSYQKDLDKMVADLSSNMSLKDKESLSRYVTHRKLVLDLMQQILDRQLECQGIEGKRVVDEKLIHDLLFRQYTEEPGSSDLWMLNEEYLYFKGVSEYRLNQIIFNGKKLFREEISEEEERYLTSLGENRAIKRPDILLFPSERKCIIIELKTPDTNLALHLNQINKYAYFIRNFSTEDFMIDTFYGYLIGESLEPRDVRAFDGDFIYDPKFNYCYRPSKKIPDDTSSHDGSLYTEVMQYSVILKRAKMRNDVFINKLFHKEEDVYKDSKNTNNNSLHNETIDLFTSEQ